jgi:1-acyl-sn-glycerol-3-phosphate acyltransferase
MTETGSSRGVLWTLYERLAMHIGLGSLALICLGWLPFALVLQLVLPRALGQRVGRKFIQHGCRFYLGLLETLCACEFDLSALDALPAQGRLIIAANHPSLLDAVLILSRLPDAVCVMKAALMRHPLFGAAARLARYIRNDGMLQIVQQSREALAGGAQVLMFPEGTRTKAFPIDPLTPTLGLIAIRSGVPVQTVLLDFSTPYLGKDWPLFRRPVLPLRVQARLGRRFEAPTGDHAAFTRALEAYWRQVLPASPHD